MRPAIRIVGHGLAGSLLAWDLHLRGVPFEVFGLRGEPLSASHVGGGIINPVTGQRFVKSWRVDDLLPRALQLYAGIEERLSIRLVRRVRVRRLFTSDREQRIVETKLAAGELSPYVDDVDRHGVWIHGAARVDTGRLVESLRAFWRSLGVWREVDSAWETLPGDGPLIRALGEAELTRPEFSFAGFVPAKGEVITVEAPELDPGVVVNRGFWLLPLEGGLAKVGATVERGRTDRTLTPAAADALLAFAREFAGPHVALREHLAGVRVTTPDRHPVIGWAPGQRLVGVLNGLGSKGALLAPALAHAWASNLAHGTPFDPALDIDRFRSPLPPS